MSNQGDGVPGLRAARLAWGTLLIAAPRPPLSLVSSSEVDGRAVAFARVLGTRQLAEEWLVQRHPRRAWRRAGAAVDGVHALSCVAFMRRWPQRRALLAANALVSGAFALTGWRAAG